MCKFEKFHKVKKVIESCKTQKQMKVAMNVIQNYHNVYKDRFLSDELFDIHTDHYEKTFCSSGWKCDT